MKQEEISINICGDFYIDPLLNDINYFNNDILEEFHASDYNIVNLEAPIAEDLSKKILKSGPHLRISPETLCHLKLIRTDLVTLANNHIMDYGTHGLRQTFSICKESSMSWVGAGMTLQEAQTPFIKEIKGTKIAILNLAENEFSIATRNKPGANPLDIAENVRQIRKAKENNDYVLVIIHGGHERYPLPSPRMVSQYRFFAENGASAIIGHHTHCISGFEIYNNVPIFYSLGNFLFTMKSEFESANTGLILNLKAGRDKGLQWELVPVRQDRETFAVSKINGNEKKAILDEVKHYTDIISNEELLLKKWEDFVGENFDLVLYRVFSPINMISNRYLKGVIRRLGFDRFFIKSYHFTKILSYIKCEALSDVSASVIKKYLEENENCNS